MPAAADLDSLKARRLHVGGVVQGVGFRPFVYRLALGMGITGWVLNAENGVEIHAEGQSQLLDDFAEHIRRRPPPAARIAEFTMQPAAVSNCATFEIRPSVRREKPTVRVSPDLPVCDACLLELFDPGDRRYLYPYINCTDCGPRYSIVKALPYDRPQTTMRDWPMCERCAAEYEDPLDRRFHAQPVACAQCGPTYILQANGEELRGTQSVARAARLLSDGAVVAIKGIGGYHLACDARNAAAVHAIRERKYRKERPFALMVADRAQAAEIVCLGEEAQALLTSQARPIVLAPAKCGLEGIAPDNDDFGVMLPSTPVQHLLFAAGAPAVMVMTSANRSSEPIAYRDDDARETLAGIADALLVGEREIARRLDDSVVTAMPGGVTVIRHARGYAPQAVTRLPTTTPMIAVGADLKNAVAIVVRGEVYVSQHIGDLEHYEALRAFKETIADLRSLYELPDEGLVIAHDAHPEYASSGYVSQLHGTKIAVQHHRAHVASVLAEREAYEKRVVGMAFDGTGYGEDGTIWGGEVFVGSIATGLERVAHLRAARLPGGDAAARFPVQAAAGFLESIDVPDLTRPPFNFPPRYAAAQELLRKNVRVFATTSMGRLFDTVAALLGFTREITFEAQAAMWVEHLARAGLQQRTYAFDFDGRELDFRPVLAQIVDDRLAGGDARDIALGFHTALVRGIATMCDAFAEEYLVASGGVFQNSLLTSSLQALLGERLWINGVVPANDGGICVGQAAIAGLSLR